MSIAAWLRLMHLVSVLGGLLMILVMLLWSPSDLGPFGVTLWFLAALVVMSAVLGSGLYWLKGYFQVHESRLGRLRASVRQGLLLAGLVTVSLAFSSLGQLSWLDVVLFGTVLLIIEFYVRYRWPQD